MQEHQGGQRLLQGPIGRAEAAALARHRALQAAARRLPGRAHVGPRRCRRRQHHVLPKGGCQGREHRHPLHHSPAVHRRLQRLRQGALPHEWPPSVPRPRSAARLLPRARRQARRAQRQPSRLHARPDQQGLWPPRGGRCSRGHVGQREEGGHHQGANSPLEQEEHAGRHADLGALRQADATARARPALLPGPRCHDRLWHHVLHHHLRFDAQARAGAGCLAALLLHVARGHARRTRRRPHLHRQHRLPGGQA
mmetsp:Transcript_11008/g.23537  ORF Transcript_11008/g.23537 Transcript_11008/m.23537 type:complete len:253 (+) Transcript_11008:1090-1848(+)